LVAGFSSSVVKLSQSIKLLLEQPPIGQTLAVDRELAGSKGALPHLVVL
jgi:hypothetical protein